MKALIQNYSAFKKVTCFGIAVFLGNVLFTLPTLADDTTQTDINPFEMSLEQLMDVRITTASRKEEHVSEAPATVYVVTARDIRMRGYSVLADVLRDLPGMDIVENYFSEMGTLVPVRGVVGNNKIIILINGMRINSPGGEEVMIRRDFSIRFAKQIEIIYGPGSTLYGQDAINAVINIITTTPEEVVAGEITATAGSFDYYEGYASIATLLGDAAGKPVKLSGYVHYTDADLSDLSKKYPDWWERGFGGSSITDGTPPTRIDKGFNAFLRLESEESSLQIWYRKSQRSSSEGGYTGILYFVDEAVWDDSQLVVEGKNTLEISDSVSLVSSLIYSRYEIDSDSRYVFPISSTELFLDDYKYGIGSGVSLEETLHVEVTEKFSFIAGIKGRYNDITPKATVPGGADTDGSIVAQAGSFMYYTTPGDPSSLVVVPRATDLHYDELGFYVEGKYLVTDWLKLVAGARMDISSRYDDKPFSPRLAAIYHNDENNFTAKYIYTRAFVAPAPYFSYNVFDNGTALNTANPNLEPEEATSHEINFTWTPENILLGLSLYYNTQDNLILIGDLALPANVVMEEIYLDLSGDDTRTLTRTANGGESKSRGVDLYGRYHNERVSIWGSYSFVDVDSEIGGVSGGLPQLSSHNVRLGVTYEILESLFITPSLIYRSDIKNVADSFSLDDEIENPFELNAHILYTPIENVDLFVTLRNITDERNAQKGVVSPTPQEPFRAYAGARLRF